MDAIYAVKIRYHPISLALVAHSSRMSTKMGEHVSSHAPYDTIRHHQPVHIMEGIRREHKNAV